MGHAYGLRNYPWRCLCFLILQETRTTPFLLKTLQSLHIFLTDALTFILYSAFKILIVCNYSAVPHLRPPHVQEVQDSEAETNEPGAHPESALTWTVTVTTWR